MGVKVDGVLLEVIGNTFMSIAEEMGAVLVKSAYSTNIKERKDCSCGLFDAAGHTIAQAEHIPMHLGSLLETVNEIHRFYREDEIFEGDMFIINDPYNGGGTHLPDICIAAPVFYEGKVVAYAMNIAHHSDVGGRVPGSNAADSKSIYEEGVRIPPVKIFNRGVLNEDIQRLILLNCRVNEIRRGDMNAQFACCRKGVERITETFARYGSEVTLAAMEGLLDYSERRIRNALRKIPNGSYTFTDYLDSDGCGSGLVPVTVTVEILDNEILLDFTDNVPQVAGALNLTDTALRACIYYSVRCVIDPMLPPNGGYYRAIQYRTKPGTLVCCSEPAAVAGRTDTAQRVVSCIMGALAQALPHSVTAGSHDAISGIYFGGEDPKTGKYYIYVETIAGGSGARFNKDGLDVVQVHMTNTGNLPIESLESEYPLMVDCFQMIPDSGGAGEYRGGLGVRRDIRIIGHDCSFSIKADRQRVAPWGLLDGKAGAMGQVILNPDSDCPELLDSKRSGIPVGAGSVVSVRTPGAGGYGSPSKRDWEKIKFDLEEGLISPESAIQDYGWTQEDLAQVKLYHP